MKPDKQWNGHKLSDSTKKRNIGICLKNENPSHMFNSFLCTFLKIFQVTCAVFLIKSAKKKKITEQHKE